MTIKIKNLTNKYYEWKLKKVNEKYKMIREELKSYSEELKKADKEGQRYIANLYNVTILQNLQKLPNLELKRSKLELKLN